MNGKVQYHSLILAKNVFFSCFRIPCRDPEHAIRPENVINITNVCALSPGSLKDEFTNHSGYIEVPNLSEENDADDLDVSKLTKCFLLSRRVMAIMSLKL